MAMRLSDQEAASSRCDSLRLTACEIHRDQILLKQYGEECLTLMRSHAGSLRVQRSGTLVIIALCEKQQIPTMLGELGAITQLFLAWKLHVNDETFCKSVIVALRSLSVAECNRAKICTPTGLRVLLSTLRTFPRRESIQIAGAALVANLTFECEERGRSVLEAGGLPVLLQGLDHFHTASSARLHVNSCMALRNLMSSAGASEEVFKVDESLSSFQHIIRVHTEPLPVQESLYVLLSVLKCVNSLLIRNEVRTNIHNLLLQFLQRTVREPPAVFERCHELCFALLRANVAVGEATCFPASDNKALEIAIAYGDCYTQRNTPSAANVIASASMWIRLLMKDETNRRLVVKIPNGIGTLVQCVVCLANRPSHVEHALLALGNAVFDSDIGKVSVRENGGLRSVAEVMRLHCSIAAVSEACLLTIQGMCSKDEENGKLAVSLSMHALCIDAMKSFSNNPSIQERGLAAINSLGSSTEIIHALREERVMDIADDAKRKYPYSRNIVALHSRIESILGENCKWAWSQTKDDAKQRRLMLFRKSSSKRIDTW